MAAHQRLRLVKSARRDRRAWDYARYRLIDSRGRRIGPEDGMSVDQVETFLLGTHEDAA